MGRGPKPKPPKPLDLLPLRAKLPRPRLSGKSSGTSSRSPASWDATWHRGSEGFSELRPIYFSKIKSYGNRMEIYGMHLKCIINLRIIYDTSLDIIMRMGMNGI